MPTYRLSAQVTVSAYCDIEAENETQAKIIAEGLPVVVGSQHSSGYGDGEAWFIDEADGEPEDIRIAED